MLSWSNLSTWNSSFSNSICIEVSADEDEEELKNQNLICIEVSVNEDEEESKNQIGSQN